MSGSKVFLQYETRTSPARTVIELSVWGNEISICRVFGVKELTTSHRKLLAPWISFHFSVNIQPQEKREGKRQTDRQTNRDRQTEREREGQKERERGKRGRVGLRRDKEGVRERERERESKAEESKYG